MDLVVHEVVELEDVHVAHRDRVREGLAGATVEQTGLAVGRDELHAVAVGQGRGEQTHELVVTHTVEDRGRHRGAGLSLDAVGGQAHGPLLAGLTGRRGVPPARGHPAQVELQDLTDVHTAGHTQRVEDDVDRGSVG